MPAWRFVGVGSPLELHDVPVPVPGKGEVLVRVSAVGLCHTDVGILTDPTWQQRVAATPLTLGHEVAGTVEAVGPGVSTSVIGRRAGIFPAGRTRPGLGRDGGYAPYCLALLEDLVPVPEGVSDELAALGTDAGRASYRAVFLKGGARRGTRLGIIGLGGLGQMGARLAVLAGVEVFAVDVKEGSREIAASLGVEHFAHDVSELAHHGLDVVVDFAGSGSTTTAALSGVRAGGIVVQVGMARTEATVSLADLVFRDVTLVGSRGGTCEDVAAVYAVFASGQVEPISHRIVFEEVPWALAELEQGRVSGRFVLTY